MSENGIDPTSCLGQRENLVEVEPAPALLAARALGIEDEVLALRVGPDRGGLLRARSVDGTLMSVGLAQTIRDTVLCNLAILLHTQRRPAPEVTTAIETVRALPADQRAAVLAALNEEDS